MKRNNLVILRLVTLEAQGLDQTQIAALTGFTAGAVSQMLGTPEAEIIRKNIEAQTIDTVAEVQTDAQTMAPNMLRILHDIAMDPKQKATARIAAATRALGISGHGEVKIHEFRRGNSLEKEYANKTEEEIRKDILSDIDDGSPKGLPDPNKTVH